jgi:hypothetical protein
MLRAARPEQAAAPVPELEIQLSHNRPVQDRYEPVAKNLWPPDGKPPRKLISNKAALKRLNEELDHLFGKADRDPTSLLRVIGRRK